MPALLTIGASLAALLQLQRKLLASSVDDDVSSTASMRVKLNSTAASAASRADLRPTAYGLACVLYCITVSRMREHQLKLMEMDVNMEQWKELQVPLNAIEQHLILYYFSYLQRLMEPGAALGAKTGVQEEPDPPEAVRARIQASTNWRLDSSEGQTGCLAGHAQIRCDSPNGCTGGRLEATAIFE